MRLLKSEWEADGDGDGDGDGHTMKAAAATPAPIASTEAIINSRSPVCMYLRLGLSATVLKESGFVEVLTVV